LDLAALFSLCLSVPYKRAGVSADYAAVRRGGDLFLLFQDSAGENDWRRNLDFLPRAVPWSDYWAHGGFVRTFSEIWPKIEPFIEEPGVRGITVAGYSHGAALACLAFEAVRRRRGDLGVRLCGAGFGCPRVFFGVPSREEAARWAQFTRVWVRGDAVAALPPAVLGFSHVGEAHPLGKEGAYGPVEAHRSETILRELGHKAR